MRHRDVHLILLGRDHEGPDETLTQMSDDLEDNHWRTGKGKAMQKSIRQLHALQAVSLFRGYRLFSESKAEASIRLKSEEFLPQWDSKNAQVTGAKPLQVQVELSRDQRPTQPSLTLRSWMG